MIANIKNGKVGRIEAMKVLRALLGQKHALSLKALYNITLSHKFIDPNMDINKRPANLLYTGRDIFAMAERIGKERCECCGEPMTIAQIDGSLKIDGRIMAKPCRSVERSERFMSLSDEASAESMAGCGR